MKTINEYIQKRHIQSDAPGTEITDFNELIEGNFYKLKNQYNDDYYIFSFQSIGGNALCDSVIYYFELLSISDEWSHGQKYIKSQNDKRNYILLHKNNIYKVYIATDEEIKRLEQARK